MATNHANSGPLGFEDKLWAAADQLRGHVDPAEYKHVVLGLIFLKYIADAFQTLYVRLANTPYADPEDRDEYTAEKVFWVPKAARWHALQDHAKQPDIGERVDAAMEAIERANPTLKGVLPKDYARPTLNKQRLGELIDLVAAIALGDEASQSKDILGRVYEYFLGQFAAAEGKRGGQFYTARSVVNLLVAMLQPYQGRVYDPCCGSGGMFVQSEQFVEAHGGNRFALSLYGQESNPTTWRLCKMNLAIRGIDGDLGPFPADTFFNDLHPDLRADHILANPPFNMSAWGGDQLQNDVRWRFGVPPASNANFAWVQHIIHHLAPNGRAGFVLANGSMSTQSSGEGQIRQSIVEAGLVDCMVALPGQLFYTTQIPVCLWFLDRARENPSHPRYHQTLFVDARNLGSMISRTQRELTAADIARIAGTYHAWRAHGDYQDIPGFCASATLDDIRAHNFVLTPGRYVGIEDAAEDGAPFEERMESLVLDLASQFDESSRLQSEIVRNLQVLGYDI